MSYTIHHTLFIILHTPYRQLEGAFSHIKIGAGTHLPFEEFRRCLLNGGELIFTIYHITYTTHHIPYNIHHTPYTIHHIQAWART
ncbi:hypothetical protein EON63_17315 [archaeon]|nr:MAG: hypothetical protein EON63_17315 [archaeon]